MATTTKSKKASKGKQAKLKPDANQMALVASLRGSLSTMKLTVDGYLREKYAETEVENSN